MHPVIFIPLLPLAAFVINILIGKRLKGASAWLSILAIFAACAIAVTLFKDALTAPNADFKIELRFPWADLGPVKFEMGILVDNLTAIMLMVVTLVGGLIHLFSVGYMHGDSRYSRFFAYLSLFSFSMLGLVLSNNLWGLYIFWELVGVSSYLLIGFWFERPKVPPDLVPAQASKKAFIVNRVGDFGFFIGILIVFTTTGMMRYADVFAAVSNGQLTGTLLTIAGLCLFCGAVGKSAQFPLHVWLPDAMAGPTPVSALIHAATMVAAGVYMVGRIYPLLSPDALVVVTYIGGITAFMAATIAVVQNDIKRVLAYSTVSQLGYMMMGLGAGAYFGGLFHLATHACFKACLFLGSGSVIHAMHHALHHDDDPQDLRNMGGLKAHMPLTHWTFLIATIAIAGVPFTSGFLSKDAILAGAYAFGILEHPKHVLIPLFGFVSAGLTAFYMFRLVFMAFHGRFAKGEEALHHIHESPAVMTIPLIVLATLSLWFFYAPNPFSDEGWVKALLVKPASVATGAPAATAEPAAEAGAAESEAHDPIHAAHLPAMILSILIAGTGIGVAVSKYRNGTIALEGWAASGSSLYRLLANKYYFDEIYDRAIVRPVVAFSRSMGWTDLNVIDGIVNTAGWVTRQISALGGLIDLHIVDGLVNLIGMMTLASGATIRRVQTGRVQNYLLGVLGVVLVLLLMQMW